MSRAGRHRPERVAQLLKETLADAVATRLKDPRIGFVTVTQVAVSPDLTHARIHVSVMGTEDEKTRAIEGLRSAAGFLRSHLGRTLTLRSVPDLHFELDRGIEHAARINRLLDELSHEAET